MEVAESGLVTCLRSHRIHTQQGSFLCGLCSLHLHSPGVVDRDLTFDMTLVSNSPSDHKTFHAALLMLGRDLKRWFKRTSGPSPRDRLGFLLQVRPRPRWLCPSRRVSAPRSRARRGREKRAGSQSPVPRVRRPARGERAGPRAAPCPLGPELGADAGPPVAGSPTPSILVVFSLPGTLLLTTGLAGLVRKLRDKGQTEDALRPGSGEQAPPAGSLQEKVGVPAHLGPRPLSLSLPCCVSSGKTEASLGSQTQPAL